MSKSVRWLSAVLMLAACQIASQATAQSWPDRPIKFISSQAAGGGTDVLGRLVADQLSARLGQPIIYENRPGGGNVIGTQAAARSAPDGYTFFFATGAALVTDPYTFKSLPYDPMKDFTVLSRHRRSAVHGAGESGPAGEKPCRAVRLRQGQSGQARGRHRRRAALLRHDRRLAQQARRHADFLCALHADDAGRAGCAHRPRAAPDHRRTDRARPCHGGKLRALAVTSAKRLPDFPDVPAVAETFPGFDFAGWFVLAAPTGVPEPIAARVNREMAAIMTDPAIVKKLGDVGYVSHGGGTLKEVRDYVQAQHAAWGTLVKEIGLQPE